MALTPPQLDDRDFDRLLREGDALIARHFPAWTDRNPSDPGITLVELFAQLIEAAIYQVDRVPERSLEHFAALVGVTRREGEAIADTLARAFAAVRARERAVLAEEFVGLVLAAVPEAARAHAAVRLVEGGLFPDETVIEVTVLSDAPGDPAPLPAPELLARVFAELDGRRLLTARVAVVPPAYRDVVIEAEIRAAAAVLDPAGLRIRVEDAVRAFLDPLTGGLDGTGWPFGRPLYRSELFQRLEGVAGVDHVARLALGTGSGAPAEVDRIDALAPTSLMRLAGLRVGVRTE